LTRFDTENSRERGQSGQPSGQPGFTLLEVVIALLIVATVLVSLLGLQARTINAADRQQKLTMATMLAQQQMSETELNYAANQSGDEGTFEPPYDNYRWQVEFNTTPLAAVREVTVTVAWGEAGSNEDVTLTSFLFN